MSVYPCPLIELIIDVTTGKTFSAKAMQYIQFESEQRASLVFLKVTITFGEWT